MCRRSDGTLPTPAAMFAASVVFAAALVAPAQDEPVRYDGYRVVLAKIRTVGELNALLALEPDVWTHGIGVGPLEVSLSPDAFDRLVGVGIEHEVLVEDLGPLIDAERRRLAAPDPEGPWYADYRPLAEFNDRLDELAAAHPALATPDLLGLSVQGREIRGLRITAPGGPRPIFLVNGCQHAREWISPMAVMYFAEQLLAAHAGGDPRALALLEGLEFWIVPVVNPDGYVYTWTTDRLWRKNRGVNPSSPCVGVDLNRNWEVGWHAPFGGASTDPCSQNYRGPTPWSEPEVAAMRDWAGPHAARIAVHMDVHSFGQLILSPWAYTPALPPDIGLFDELGRMQQDAIRGVHGMTYWPGTFARLLYIGAGTATDYGYQELTALSWTYELRPVSSAQGGFLLPAQQIIPTAQEFTEAMLQLGEYLLESPCYPDCDGSGTLDFFDFLCFQNAFLAAVPYADCDGSGALDFFDFLCFQDQFLAGCR
jgi:hypothetical protein